MPRFAVVGFSILQLAFACATLRAADVGKAEWSQFHGPARNNVSPDTGLLTKWPDNGPPLVWETRGAGRGYASLAIAAGRIYTLGDGLSTAEDADEYVTCFDTADGKQLWTSKVGAPWTSGKADWQSSRSTPTVDGERLYALSPHGKLVCLETASGKLLWSKDMSADLGGKKDDKWGYSESVLIDGDKLVCTPGGGKTTMAALDKKSGDEIWKAVWSEDRGAGHSSMAVSEIAGIRMYVQVTGGGAIGVRASDGKLMWSYPVPKTTAVIPSPLVRGDLVFISVGYGTGGALLKQAATFDGEVKVEEVYDLKPELSNKHGGVVLLGDRVYGDTDAKGMLFCADLQTGKSLWKGERAPGGSGTASLAAADGHLYALYANGLMALVKADAEQFAVISSFTIPGSGERPSWSHPVIVGGKLYVREQDKILCYDVKAKN